jgi:hypothetical protein
MKGRHRAVSDRSRRHWSSVPAGAPRPRRPGGELVDTLSSVTGAVGITDARTRIEHLMSDAVAMAHRHAGRYPALCGIEVLAASLTERHGNQCSSCRERAVSPAGGGGR